MTEYILSLSYGKDSLACIEAIKRLGLPLDRIVHAEVWATDTIPADLPPMMEFKKKADKIIKERYGIDVEHVCAVEKKKNKLTYSRQFYKKYNNGKNKGKIYGFPMLRGNWCTEKLKANVIKTYLREIVLSCAEEKKGNRHTICRGYNGFSSSNKTLVQQQVESECVNERGFSTNRNAQCGNINVVQYLGIAADEPERIKRHNKQGLRLPLVEIGWTEEDCYKWCEENDLLSPIYINSARGGCWFCHNQGVDQLRLLRKNYPDLWELLLKWDKDSPVTFKPDGHTVHDFDKRFRLEDLGAVPKDRKFRWKMLSLKEDRGKE